MVIKMAEKLKAYLSKNTDLLYFSKSAMVTDMCKKALEDLYIKKAETMSVLLDEFKVDKKVLLLLSIIMRELKSTGMKENFCFRLLFQSC
jgi:hypothetical protein